MPASRISGIVLATAALTLAAITTPATAASTKPVRVTTFSITESAFDELPAAPKAPSGARYSNTFTCIPAACSRAKPRPPMVRFQWGGTPAFAPGRSTTTQLRRR
jgi:hypothetical protein